MEFRVGEIEPARGLVGHDLLFDLGDGEPLAGRPALVQAEIAIGVVFALLLEHADLVLAHEYDATVAILHFRRLCDELLGHAATNLRGTYVRSARTRPVGRRAEIQFPLQYAHSWAQAQSA